MIAWLAGAAATFFAGTVARWLAWKVVVWTLLVVILPIVINNVLYSVLQGVMTLVNEQASASGLASVTVQLTGLAGYLGQHCKIPESVALVLGAVAFKVAISMLPIGRK